MIGFQIVEGPRLFPGMNIDRSSDGPTVDTHYELNDHRLYLSERIVYEAAMTGILHRADYLDGVAERYGMLTADQAADLHTDLAASEEARVAAELALAELKPVQDALDRAAQRWGDHSADEPRRHGKAA